MYIKPSVTHQISLIDGVNEFDGKVYSYSLSHRVENAINYEEF